MASYSSSGKVLSLCMSVRSMHSHAQYSGVWIILINGTSCAVPQVGGPSQRSVGLRTIEKVQLRAVYTICCAGGRIRVAHLLFAVLLFGSSFPGAAWAPIVSSNSMTRKLSVATPPAVKFGRIMSKLWFSLSGKHVQENMRRVAIWVAVLWLIVVCEAPSCSINLRMS